MGTPPRLPTGLIKLTGRVQDPSIGPETGTGPGASHAGADRPTGPSIPGLGRPREGPISRDDEPTGSISTPPL